MSSPSSTPHATDFLPRLCLPLYLRPLADPLLLHCNRIFPPSRPRPSPLIKHPETRCDPEGISQAGQSTTSTRPRSRPALLDQPQYHDTDPPSMGGQPVPRTRSTPPIPRWGLQIDSLSSARLPPLYTACPPCPVAVPGAPHMRHVRLRPFCTRAKRARAPSRWLTGTPAQVYSPRPNQPPL